MSTPQATHMSQEFTDQAGARAEAAYLLFRETGLPHAAEDQPTRAAGTASRRFNLWFLPACCIGIIALAIVFFAILAAEVGHRRLGRDT